MGAYNQLPWPLDGNWANCLRFANPAEATRRPGSSETWRLGRSEAMIFGFWNHFRKKRYLLGLSWGLGACLEPLGEVSGGDGLLVEPFGNFSGRSCGSLGTFTRPLGEVLWCNFSFDRWGWA